MTKVRKTNIRGWKTYEGEELSKGQVLMINDGEVAYVMETYFVAKDSGDIYDFTLTGAKIDDDGTYYDPDDNNVVLGKIIAILDEGFVNELTEE